MEEGDCWAKLCELCEKCSSLNLNNDWAGSERSNRQLIEQLIYIGRQSSQDVVWKSQIAGRNYASYARKKDLSIK